MSKALLRPEFTRVLARRLVQGESINMTAPHGYGRRQTLLDLRRVLPPGMRVLHANLKFCLDDCSALLADLAVQAGLNPSEVHNLGQLLEAQARHLAPSLVILHNFDLLRFATRRKAHDPLFDSALLPYLKTFSTHPHIALLLVSEAVYPDWPLPCEVLPLPTLV